MKVYIFSILIMFALFSCQNQEADSSKVIEQLRSENEALKNGTYKQVKDAKTFRSLIMEIENHISKIEDKKSRFLNVKAKENGTSMSQEDMLDHLKFINLSLLNVKLKTNHLNNGIIELHNENGLEKDSIKLLKQELHNSIASLLSKDAEIEALHKNMDSKSEEYNKINREYRNQKSYSEVLYTIIHTKFYFIGTQEELLLKEIIRKTETNAYELNADASDALFKFIIADEQSLIALDADSVKLLSVHPSKSYEYLGEGHVDALKINDYKQFWDKTEYLIIQVN